MSRMSRSSRKRGPSVAQKGRLRGEPPAARSRTSRRPVPWGRAVAEGTASREWFRPPEGLDGPAAAIAFARQHRERLRASLKRARAILAARQATEAAIRACEGGPPSFVKDLVTALDAMPEAKRISYSVSAPADGADRIWTKRWVVLTADSEPIVDDEAILFASLFLDDDGIAAMLYPDADGDREVLRERAKKARQNAEKRARR
jgi:hypothetical protein